MSFKKFIANNTREAMRMVRETLGEDAVIISNRSLEDQEGVEILATQSQNMAALDAISTKASNYREKHDDYQIFDEIKKIKSLLEHHFVGLAWKHQSATDTDRMIMYRYLFSRGIRPSLAWKLSQEIFIQSEGALSLRIKKFLKSKIKKQHYDLLKNGGRVLFWGPSGSGKTTCMLKMASEFSLHRDPKDVLLVQCGEHSLGSRETLENLTTILNIKYEKINGPEEMRILIEDKHIRLVLIDAPNISNLEYCRNFKEKIHPVTKFLVLPCALGDHAFSQWMSLFNSRDAGLILTKLDEPYHAPSLLSSLIMHHVPICYSSSSNDILDPLSFFDEENLLHSVLESASADDCLLEQEVLAYSPLGSVLENTKMDWAIE